VRRFSSIQNLDFMSSSKFPPIAVIADAHFHDLYGDYDFDGVDIGGRRMTARRLTDTMRSTRVFNESYQALRAALDEVVTRGIKHIVLLGDYSDDGQNATLAALRRLLDTYVREHGLIFAATPGNHDIFGRNGRHHAKRLLNSDGSYTIVASDSEFVDDDAAGMVVTDKMYCPGYPAGLQAMASTGFFRRQADLHWETPFGTDDDPAARSYSVFSEDGQNHYRLMDGSYLVEPVADLWLMMIDANVFEPRNGAHVAGDAGAFIDSTNAGWNAVLRHKRFIFDWIKDVTARATSSGKQLLTFSHYPMLDMLNATENDERALMGETSSLRRTPGQDVADAALDAGLHLHFSGHLHINDTALIKRGTEFLVNIGVPSLVAFPAAFKVITLDDTRMNVETVSLDHLPIDAAISRQYRVESELTGKSAGRMLQATNYGEFISEHVQQLVVHRYLRREWPSDIARIVPLLTLADLYVLGRCQQSVAADDGLALLRAERSRKGFEGDEALLERLDAFSAVELLADWYRLRTAREMALQYIRPERLANYRLLITAFADRQSIELGGVREKFARMLRMMGQYMTGLPSRDFCVDLTTGAIIREIQ
jgi:3',5'-cyclic AMP phosphodiesterase CpdA